VIVVRHRKMKERLGMTEMRKAANRVIFGEVSLIRHKLNQCCFVNTQVI